MDRCKELLDCADYRQTCQKYNRIGPLEPETNVVTLHLEELVVNELKWLDLFSGHTFIVTRFQKVHLEGHI